MSAVGAQIRLICVARPGVYDRLMNARSCVLYTAGDMARLHQGAVLRQLGFPLDQLAQVLDDPQWELRAAAERHLELTQRMAAIDACLCSRLRA